MAPEHSNLDSAKKYARGSDASPEGGDPGGADDRRLSALRYRTAEVHILETMQEGVVLVDPVSRAICLTNPTFDRMFGYATAELLGRPIEPLFSILSVQRRRLARVVRGRSKTGENAPMEFECARKDGTRFVASCVVTPLTMNGTEHWLAVLNDVTERKELEREIIEIANREQQRIGSDLHDGLGQELTGIALMLKGVLTQLRKEGSAAHRDVEEVIGLVNNAIDSTRTLARGLSPVGSGRGDLGAAIQTLAARVSERSGVRVVCHLDCAEPLPLSETAAAHVYRIVQEALTNAMRHSGAREISIRLQTGGDELHLQVSDDGRGFEHWSRGSGDWSRSDVPAGDVPGGGLPVDGPGGLGLKIMRYRAQMLGGDLVIETHDSGGTSVSCSCPLDWSVEPEWGEAE